MPRKDLIRLRAGTTAQWDAADAASVTDPTRLLAANEQGYDTTAKIYKIGDGVTKFANLPGFLDETGLSASIDARATDEDGEVVTFNDNRYVINEGNLDDLPVPSYWAHRLGAGYAPEETIEAGRVSTACGVDGVEWDGGTLADGSIGLLHDTTVDRTTDGTGLATGFTAPAFRALNAAAKFAWNGRAVPACLQSEAFDTFGRQTRIMVESKDTAALNATIADIVRRGLTRSVIVEASSLAALTTIKAAGLAAYYYWGATLVSPTVASVIAAGADYLGFDASTMSDADISTLVATGKPVIPWTVNRRVEKTRLLALGVSGFLSDQPVYLKATTAQRTVDSWRSGVYGHGLIKHAGGNPDGPTITSGALRLLGTNANDYRVVGEVSPVANPSAVTIDLDVAWETLPADMTRHLDLCLTTDDGAYSFASGATNGDGYQVFLRGNGNVSLFKVIKGSSAVSLASFTTAAMTAGAFAHLKLIVTASTITAVRTDVSAGTTSGALTSGVAITSIPTTALPAAIAAGQKLYLPTGQVATVSGAGAALSATSIPVNSITPSSTIASGSAARLCLQVTDSTYRGGYVHVAAADNSNAAPGLFKNLAIT